MRDGKSNFGRDPLLLSAFAFWKLIGSNLEGSGTGPVIGITKPPVPPPRNTKEKCTHMFTLLHQLKKKKSILKITVTTVSILRVELSDHGNTCHFPI